MSLLMPEDLLLKELKNYLFQIDGSYVDHFLGVIQNQLVLWSKVTFEGDECKGIFRKIYFFLIRLLVSFFREENRRKKAWPESMSSTKTHIIAKSTCQKNNWGNWY